MQQNKNCKVFEKIQKEICNLTNEIIMIDFCIRSEQQKSKLDVAGRKLMSPSMIMMMKLEKQRDFLLGILDELVEDQYATE